MSTSPAGDTLSRQRSASPAKRSAALMEGEDDVPVTRQSLPGTSSLPDTSLSTANDGAVDAHQSLEDEININHEDNSDLPKQSNHAKHAHDHDPPPYSAIPPSPTDLTIDQQVSQIMTLVQQSPSPGQKGFVVSYKWLARVLSRSTNAPEEMEYEPSATEGDVGSIDNSGIVSPGAFANAITPFEQTDLPFIHLIPGLRIGLSLIHI